MIKNKCRSFEWSREVRKRVKLKRETIKKIYETLLRDVIYFYTKQNSFYSFCNFVFNGACFSVLYSLDHYASKKKP